MTLRDSRRTRSFRVPGHEPVGPVDLSLSPDDEAFAGAFRTWLAEHLTPPPAFSDLAEEVEWGRHWQAQLARPIVGSACTGPMSTGVGGLPRSQVALYQSEYARSQAPQPVNRVGINLVGPTLLAHGSDEQRRRWMPRILSADELWCQLFSEPDAGSDLASLTTRADAVEGGYLVTGRKVWTSYAQFATWGLCLARTAPEAPPSRRASRPWSIDMQATGIDVRPLVQLTGDAEFNEVFFDDVFVPVDQLRRGRGPGLDGGRLHAGPRAGHYLPVQGTGGP